MLCTLVHNFWYWIYKKRVLEVTARDSKSNDIKVQQEATKAGHSLLHFIGQMLHQYNGIMLCGNSFLFENMTTVIKRVMQHFLLINGEGFRQIIPDFMIQTCDQIEVIIEHISTSKEQLMFDYQVLRRLLLLRLKVSSGLSMADIEAIPGAKLRRPPSQNYIVEGAGSYNVNGRYTLKKNDSSNSARFVTYTKGGHDANTLYIIQQCLFGPDNGKWFISQRKGNDLNVQEDTKYYVNNSVTATSPPEAGWTAINGTSPCPALTSTVAEADSTESEQQERHDLLDVSRLDMTDQQRKLWQAVQELTNFVELSESDRTEVVKDTIKHSLALLKEL